MNGGLALRFTTAGFRGVGTAGFRGIMTSILTGLTGSQSESGVESTTMVSPPSLSLSKVNVGADDGGMGPTTEVGTMEEAGSSWLASRVSIKPSSSTLSHAE